MSNDSASPLESPKPPASSAVGQTANVGRATATGSAAKVFKEFKWGLLTLFLLMVVVIGLVYDGGKKKSEADKAHVAEAPPTINLDMGEPSLPSLETPPSSATSQPSVVAPPAPVETPMAPEVYVPTPPAPVTQTPLAPTPSVVTPPAERPTPPAASGSTEYVVKPGDTLTKIAHSMLPGRGSLKAIIDANKDVLPDPHRLKPGMTLKIPAASAPVEARSKPEIKNNTVNPAKTETLNTDADDYTVQSGDTLERIARKLFNDGRKWRELYEWNRDQLADPGRLRVGQTLKVKQGKPTAAAPAPEVVPGLNKSSKELGAPKKTAAVSIPVESAPVSTKEQHFDLEPELMSRTISCP